MRIFDRDGKLNFIGANNIFVGFDSYQRCCEDFGWFITDDPYIDCKDIPDGAVANDIDAANIRFDGWGFDPMFFERSDTYESNTAVFRITDGTRTAYLHLYNHHNGYYSHGFDMTVWDKIEHHGSL